MKRSSDSRLWIIVLVLSLGLAAWLSGAGAASLVPPDEIPESEAEEHEAICELEEQEFIVTGKNKALLRVHRIIRINDRRGRQHGAGAVNVSQFKELNKLEAQIRKPDGTVLNELDEEDIRRESFFEESVLYQDTWLESFELESEEFPYIVEYRYEVKYKSLLYWPAWFPQRGIPVKRSIYKLIVPNNFDFSWHLHNLDLKPLENYNKGKRELTFELENLLPFEPEVDMPPALGYKMCAVFVPKEFSLAGYEGSTASWEELGRWYCSLYRRLYKLDHKRKSTVEGLVKDYSSELDTVKALYQFVQRNIRYVAVELELGGHKPREAEDVLGSSHGDCKDMSTLLVTLLRSQGKEAYVALVRTRGEGDLWADFPSPQFNHAIAWVVMDNDTLWLDCTCSGCPLGELPRQDQGCRALVLKDHAPFMSQTPVGKTEENRIVKTLEAKFDELGALQIEVNIQAFGNCELEYRGLFSSMTAREKKEWVDWQIGRYAPYHTTLGYELERASDPNAPFSAQLRGRIFNYPAVTKRDFLVNPNLLVRLQADELLRTEERKFPVDDGFPGVTEYEFRLVLPEHLAVKAFPDEERMDFSFGSFATSYQADSNGVVYKRTRTSSGQLIEPADFSEYQEFLKRIYASDHSYIVLTRNE